MKEGELNRNWSESRDFYLKVWRISVFMSSSVCILIRDIISHLVLCNSQILIATTCLWFACDLRHHVNLFSSVDWLMVWWDCRLNSWYRWSAIPADFPAFSWVTMMTTTKSRNSVIRLRGFCAVWISGHNVYHGLNSSWWLNRHWRLWVLLIHFSVAPCWILFTRTHPPFSPSEDSIRAAMIVWGLGWKNNQKCSELCSVRVVHIDSHTRTHTWTVFKFACCFRFRFRLCVLVHV